MKAVSKRTLCAATGGLFLLTTVCGVALAAKPTSSTTSMVNSVALNGDANWQKHIVERIEHRIFKIIHASEDQKTKLTSILNNTFEQNAELRNELKSKVLDLSKAYADDSVTNERIKERLTAIEDVRAKLRTRRVEALLSAREVLSAKQRQILSERLNERFGDN